MSYKHFSDEEAAGVSPTVMVPLDAARDMCPFVYVKTCGWRSPEHNAEIGGVAQSSHMHVDADGRPDSLAIDLAVPEDHEQAKMMAAALGLAGFRQIEVSPRHFHVGMDMEKPVALFFGPDR